MDDARTKLLDAAGPIFAERGFQGATVREICRAAAANIAAVNYHFGDKERLYIETVKLASRQRAEEVPMPVRLPGTPADQRLREFVGTMLKRMIGAGRKRWQTRLMTREVLQPTSACRELVEEYFRPHFDELLAVLSELAPDSTPAFRLRQLGFSVVGQCVYYRFAGQVVAMLTPREELREHYSIQRLADHITDFTLAGLQGIGPSLGHDGNPINDRVLGESADDPADVRTVRNTTPADVEPTIFSDY